MMRTILACLILLLVAVARAHSPSDSFLTLDTRGGELAVRWDIDAADLDYLLAFGADPAGAVTWESVTSRAGDIASLAVESLTLSTDAGLLALPRPELRLSGHHGRPHISLLYPPVDLEGSGELAVEYALLFKWDATHRGIIRFVSEGGETARVSSPDSRVFSFPLDGAAPHGTSLSAFAGFVKEGVWHIWIGLDHILFLVALLLPSVLRHGEDGWSGAHKARDAAMRVLKTVTAFTLAHSVTLAIATLGILEPPSRLVESIIAASIVVATLNNFRPMVKEREWMIAGLFGLVHGFGFAGVLAETGITKGAILAPLAGFNIGVELGQLAIVAVFLPVAWALRDSLFYRRALLLGGSAAITVIAGLWCVERALDLSFMPI